MYLNLLTQEAFGCVRASSEKRPWLALADPSSWIFAPSILKYIAAERAGTPSCRLNASRAPWLRQTGEVLRLLVLGDAQDNLAVGPGSLTIGPASWSAIQHTGIQSRAMSAQVRRPDLHLAHTHRHRPCRRRPASQAPLQ